MKGQSIIEVLVALTIIVLSVSSVAAVLFGGRSILIDAQLEEEALNFSRQDMENARAAAQSGFAGLSSSSSTTGQFTRETIVETIDSHTKKVVSRVSWQNNPSRPQKVELTTLVTDWRDVDQTGGDDDGGGGLTGDWRNPRTLGSIDLGPGNSATDLDVKDKIVYISAKASTAAKPDFFIIDATNGQSPSVISSLNTGPSLNAVDAAGNYVYAANDKSNQQLQVIDVSNRSAPVVLASTTLPGISQEALSVFYLNSKVYIGTDDGTGREFHIFDVSNPSSPVWLGGKEIGDEVWDIKMAGNLAYLATDDDEELKIYDVSDPANITLLGDFNVNGGCEEGRSEYIVGAKLYFGRTDDCGHTNHHKFSVLDIASSSNIQSLGSTNIGADVNGIAVRDNLAFLGTTDSNKEFQIWDISDPQNIALWSSFNFPQVATGIDYEDNIVYVSVRSNDALRIITSQ